MEILIKNKKLEILYCKGRHSKCKLPEYVVDKFIRAINYIEASENIFDLMNRKGFNFEKLKGNNLFSIKIDCQYRLEFAIEFSDEYKTKGKVIIFELSKHYE
jgi:plasmid maintenance system killer protein